MGILILGPKVLNQLFPGTRSGDLHSEPSPNVKETTLGQYCGPGRVAGSFSFWPLSEEREGSLLQTQETQSAKGREKTPPHLETLEGKY